MAGRNDNKRLFAALFIATLILTQMAVLVSWDRQGGSVQAKSLYVSASGSTFTTIQAAVNAASPYDSIYLAPGLYNEHVNVNKEGLRIIGNDTETTRILVNELPAVLALNANNISVSNLNFTVNDYNGEGVRVNNVTGVQIHTSRFNTMGTYSQGVVLNGSRDWTLQDLFFDAAWAAVRGWGAAGGRISHCSIESGDIALTQGSSFNTVSNCTGKGAIELSDSPYNAINDNKLQAPAAFGLEMTSSDHTVLRSNELTDCGILLTSSDGVECRSGIVNLGPSAYGSEGIRLVTSTMNTFIGCSVQTQASSGNALNLQNSPSNSFSDCTFVTAATSTNGAYALGSDGLNFMNTSFTTSGSNSKGIRLNDCVGLTMMDCYFDISGSNPAAIMLENSVGTCIGTTFESVIVDSASTLFMKNYLTIYVTYETQASPLEGADVLIQDNSQAIYSTAFYSGADPRTNATGKIGPLLLTDLMFEGSSIPKENTTTVRVRMKMDYAWEEVRDVNLKLPHSENFLVPDLTRPQTPQNLTLSSVPGKPELNLSWDPVGGDTASYGVYSNRSGSWESIANVSQAWYLDTGLKDSTEYFYKVTAWDGLHESYASQIISNSTPDLTPPPQPDGVVFVVIDTYSLVIGWKRSSAPDLGGYTIYMNVTGGSAEGPFKKVGQAGPEDVTYLVDGLAPTTAYYFCLDSFDGVPNNSTMTPSHLAITKAVVITKGSIRGTVYYEADSPKGGQAPGVTVTLFGASGNTIIITTTNAAGAFRFENISLQNGLTLRAEPPVSDTAVAGNRSGYLASVVGPFDLQSALFEGDIYLGYYIYVPPPNVFIKDRSPEGINVSVAEEIYVKFSESMNTTSVESGFQVTPGLANVTFEWAALNRSVRVYHANMSYSTTYTVTISPLIVSIEGYVYGQDRANLTWNFTTKAKPYVKPNITDPADDDDSGFNDQQLLIIEILVAAAVLLIVIAVIVAVVTRRGKGDQDAAPTQAAGQGACYPPLLEPVALGQKKVFSYYEVLGVSRDATTAEIKRAYRRLSKECHPDRMSNPTPEQLADLKKKQTKLNNAKEVLLDQKKRVLYDISIGHKRADEVVIPADDPQSGDDDAVYDIDIRTVKDDEYVEDIPELSVIEEPLDRAQDPIIEGAKINPEEDLAYTLPEDLDED